MSHGLLLFIIVSYFSILFFYNVIFLHASQMGLTQHFKHTIYIYLIYSSHIIITLNSPLHTKNSMCHVPSECQAFLLAFYMCLT